MSGDRSDGSRSGIWSGLMNLSRGYGGGLAVKTESGASVSLTAPSVPAPAPSVPTAARTMDCKFTVVGMPSSHPMGEGWFVEMERVSAADRGQMACAFAGAPVDALYTVRQQPDQHIIAFDCGRVALRFLVGTTIACAIARDVECVEFRFQLGPRPDGDWCLRGIDTSFEIQASSHLTDLQAFVRTLSDEIDKHTCRTIILHDNMLCQPSSGLDQASHKRPRHQVDASDTDIRNETTLPVQPTASTNMADGHATEEGGHSVATAEPATCADQ
jgi:hypothetical protein